MHSTQITQIHIEQCHVNDTVVINKLIESIISKTYFKSLILRNEELSFKNKYDMLWYLFNKKEPYNLETLKIEFCKIDE